MNTYNVVWMCEVNGVTGTCGRTENTTDELRGNRYGKETKHIQINLRIWEDK
jgi:hypothetical protein